MCKIVGEIDGVAVMQFNIYIGYFLYPIMLFPVSVSKISSVLLLNVVPLFSSVPKLHFQISMLL